MTARTASIATATAALAPAAPAQPLPSGDHAGCYAGIAYPATYRTVTERTAGPDTITYRDTPAVIAHDARRILVSPARVEHETVAPVYATEGRWIEVPGPARRVAAPPAYRTLTERRLIAPAHLVWRPGHAGHGFASNSAPGSYGADQGVIARPTGEVLCRVLVPARYGWTRRRVTVSPGGFTTVQGPPRHVQVEQKVLIRPGRTVEHVIPAVYRAVDAVRVVRPASRQRIVVPGPVNWTSRRVMVSPARFAWAPIVCAQGTPRPRLRPILAPRPSYGAKGSSYGAASTPRGRPYAPDEILAPTPIFQSPTPAPTASAPEGGAPALVPAPYDVGHPARR